MSVAVVVIEESAMALFGQADDFAECTSKGLEHFVSADFEIVIIS